MTPLWRTFDVLEDVLSLAEAARVALDIVRASITVSVFLREWLWVYAIATRFG